MTEAEAQGWVADTFGPAAAERVAAFGALLAAGAAEQNLVAPSTLPLLWSRHLADSAQLAPLSTAGGGLWLDIGSGGGLPGLVLALLVERPFVLCEPRRLRAAFLQQSVDALGLAARVRVAQSRVEAVGVRAATITARAVMGLDALFRAAAACADRDTEWILPRGQSGAGEIQASAMLGRARFHVEHSLTDPSGVILVARGVGR